MSNNAPVDHGHETEQNDQTIDEAAEQLDDELGDDHGYGLPTPRDGEQLLPQDHEFDHNGQTVKIELVPPMLEEIEHYRDLDDDVEMETLREIVDKHITKPDIPAAKMTIKEVNCYISGIIDYGSDGGGEQMEQVKQAVREREGRGDAGN